MSIAVRPARNKQFFESGLSEYDFATELRQRVIRTQKVIGWCVIMVVIVFFGVMWKLGS